MATTTTRDISTSVFDEVILLFWVHFSATLRPSSIWASKKVNFGSNMVNFRPKMANIGKNQHFEMQKCRNSQRFPGPNGYGWSLCGCIRRINMNLHPLRSASSLLMRKVVKIGLFLASFGLKLVVFDPKLTFSETQLDDGIKMALKWTQKIKTTSSKHLWGYPLWL